jgi:hypothetical protein
LTENEKGPARKKLPLIVFFAMIIVGALLGVMAVDALGPDAAVPMLIICVGIVVIVFVHELHRTGGRIMREKIAEQKGRKGMHSALDDAGREITPDEFVSMRERYGDFPGVYVFVNRTKDTHLIGQSTEVMEMVHSHFTNKGNADVYSDFKDGDDIVITIIALENSGCKTLNELEKRTIAKYGK